MRILALLFIFSSFSALACPDLQGLYRVCLSTDGVKNKLRVVQSVKNGANVYNISWSTERLQIHIADGISRTTPIFDTGLSLISTAMCEGDILKRTLSTQEADGTISMSVTQEYSLEAGKLHFVAMDEKGVYKDITCTK